MVGLQVTQGIEGLAVNSLTSNIKPCALYQIVRNLNVTVLTLKSISIIMLAKIYYIDDYRFLLLTAFCINCESSWTAKITKSAYKKFLQNKQKHICPFCKYTEIGFSKVNE